MLQYIQAFKGVYITVLVILGILLYFTAFCKCLIFHIVLKRFPLMIFFCFFVVFLPPSGDHDHEI